MAVVFAARGFGRRELQIRIAQEIVEKRGEAAATHGEMCVFIVALAAPREARDESVDEHVGRAGVESEDFLWLGRSRKNRDIGDAPKVERDAAEFRMSVEKIVHIRNKRRALAAEGDVSRPKIADCGDAGARGDHRWLTNLQRGGRRRTETRNRMPLMENGLAVAAN